MKMGEFGGQNAHSTLNTDCESGARLSKRSTTRCKLKPIVGNPRVILIDSPLVHLVMLACFQSNMHDLCDLFLPDEIKCCASVLLFCFEGALFKPTWWNQPVLLWNVIKILAFLQLLYSR